MGWFVRRGGHCGWPTIQRGIPAHQRNLGSGVNEVSVNGVHHQPSVSQEGGSKGHSGGRAAWYLVSSATMGRSSWFLISSCVSSKEVEMMAICTQAKQVAHGVIK